MHFYKFPDPRGADEKELGKMRDIADTFNQAVMDAFSKDPRQMQAVAQELTREEIGTMKGIAALVKSADGRDGAFELMLTLQFNDVSTAALVRAVPQVAAAAVPPAMATAEAADLFRKHGLPVLEQLARNAIKPATP